MNKEKIIRYLDGFKKAFSAMTVTLVLVAAATIIFTCFLDTGSYDGKWEAAAEWGNLIGCVFALTACGAFFAENAVKNRVIRYAVILLSFAFSAVYMLENRFKWLSFTQGFRDGYYWALLAAYVIFMLTAGLFACFRNSHLTFRNYTAGVLMNSILWSVISGVLESGALTLVLIFSVLIRESEDMILRVIMLVSGLIVLPGEILLLRNVQKQEGKFLKILLSYVTFPIIVIAYLIVYIYMAKIFIKAEVPSNTIFAILAGIFCVAAPVLTMTEAVNDSRFFKKGIRIMYWLFIPFILIQCYALGVRLHAYGMTPKRFIGIVIILLEIIYLVLSLTKGKKQEWILPVFACISVLVLAVPGVNMFSVSKNLQTKTLENFMKQPQNHSASRAAAAFSYLDSLPAEFNTEVYRMTGAEKDALFDLITAEESDDETQHLSEDSREWFYFDPFVSDAKKIPVKGYREVQVGEIYWSFSNPDVFDYDELKEVPIANDRGEFLTMVDLSGYIEDYIDYAKEHYTPDMTSQEGYKEEYRTIRVNDELTVYILHMSVSGYKNGTEYIPDNINAELVLLYE